MARLATPTRDNAAAESRPLLDAGLRNSASSPIFFASVRLVLPRLPAFFL